MKPLPWQGGAIVLVTILETVLFARNLIDVPLWLFGSLVLAPFSLALGSVANAAIAFLFRWTDARFLRRLCSVVGTLLTTPCHLWQLADLAWVFGIGPKPPFSYSRQLGAMLDAVASQLGA